MKNTTKTWLVATTIAALAGCTTVGVPTEDTPEDTPEDTSDDDVAEERACTPSTFDPGKMVLTPDSASVLHSTYSEEWSLSLRPERDASDPITVLRVELHKFRGSLAGGVGVGVYKIKGDDAAPETCATCIFIEENDFDTGEERFFAARSGIVSITDYHETSDVLHGAITDLELVPMTLATGGAACETSLECPGAMRCDVTDTGTCFQPVPAEGVCPITLDLVEF